MKIDFVLIIVFIIVIAGAFLFQREKKQSYKRQASNCKSSEINSPTKHGKVTHSKEHRALINMPYVLQCKTEVFTQAELDVINKYGAWLSALASNQINLETSEQELFVEECHYFRTLSINEMLSYFSNRNDCGSIRTVWFKYLCRIKFERENPSIVSDKTKIDWGWQGPPIASGDHVFFSK